MRGFNRVVNTSFWEDEKTVNSFTPEDKYFFLYLLTNPHTTQLGIYKLVPKQAAFETGYSQETINGLIDRFENRYGVIKYSRDTYEVAVKNYLRHSIVKGGKPVMDCLLKEEKSVENKSLLIFIYNHLINIDNLNKTIKDYLIHLRKIYINKDNDNDNDNERIVPRIVNESYNESYHESLNATKKFVPPSIEEVDAYCFSNGYEYVNPERFVTFYGSKNWMVGKTKMSNWHMALAGWNSRARDNGDRKYVRTKTDIPINTDRPERFRTCPDSTWQKLKPFASSDGSFNWSDFDQSVLTDSDREWMRRNDM